VDTDHTNDGNIVVAINKELMFRGDLNINESSDWDLKLVVVKDSWSLFEDGR
jgi:hypothetical protein